LKFDRVYGKFTIIHATMKHELTTDVVSFLFVLSTPRKWQKRERKSENSFGFIAQGQGPRINSLTDMDLNWKYDA